MKHATIKCDIREKNSEISSKKIEIHAQIEKQKSVVCEEGMKKS